MKYNFLFNLICMIANDNNIDRQEIWDIVTELPPETLSAAEKKAAMLTQTETEIIAYNEDEAGTELLLSFTDGASLALKEVIDRIEAYFF